MMTRATRAVTTRANSLRCRTSSRIVSVIAIVSFHLLAAGSGEAQTKFRILANGGFHGNTNSFGSVSTFTEFLEEARLGRDYDTNTGLVFEVGGIYSITPAFGVMGSVEVFNGSNDSRFERVSPHPLFFDQTRTLSGDVADLSYTERAVHFGAVYTSDFSSFTVDLFGGPSLFFTETELIRSVGTRSVYPFDDISLNGTELATVDDKPIGFNVGGALTYRINPTFGLAFSARFSRARVELAQEGSTPLEFDAGGFRAGAGIRIAF